MQKEYVKLCRSVLGLTQTEFASLLGVSRSAISNIESGYRQANRTFISKFNDSIDADIREKVRDLLPC